MDHEQALLRSLHELAPEELRRVLLATPERDVRALDTHWPAWAHAGQRPPDDDWHIWVMLAGRGFGKTRAGAEWVSEKARTMPEARIALVAATPGEARRVMIEGPSGLLAVAADGAERRGIRWEPSLGRLTFAGGATAFVHSGANPEGLRGPEHHFAWCDELAKWKYGEATWNNLQLGLRAGARSQAVVTTTPRAVPVLRAILAMANVALTGGACRDNPHLSPDFVTMIEALHAGTRLARQELDGKLLDDVDGALFPRDLLARSRAPAPRRDDLVRVVIGVDPPATAGGDACGILVCGLDATGCGWVLADCSGAGLSPDQWARKVARAAETWRADRVVAESNQGGEMVTTVLRGAGLKLRVKRVHARVGKAARAAPLEPFFARGEAKLAGCFPELEDELAGLSLDGYAGPGRSPDRADAMVWALTELLLNAPAPPAVRRL
ncbi:MAG TPA: terminase family protein [Allosphingosinicella sp.]|nr:terminase family protein [Allosphingosinicella sp.]